MCVTPRASFQNGARMTAVLRIKVLGIIGQACIRMQPCQELIAINVCFMASTLS
jgi:hypothetical protein